jgi:hypothetical protein
MKRKIAIGWIAVWGLMAAFLLIGWFFIPHAGIPFWRMVSGASSGLYLAGRGVRYLRGHPRELDR